MKEDLQSVITSVRKELEMSGFRIVMEPQLHDGSMISIAASRTYFSWKCFILLSQHVLLKYIEDATIESLEQFYEQGFLYGKKVNKVPLFRGMQFGFIIIPCFIVNKADQQLIDYVTSRPRKHFAIFEFPVVHELSSGKTYYYEKTAVWGAVYFSEIRSLVKSVFKLK